MICKANVALLLGLWLSLVHGIPDGYILDVFPMCGATLSDSTLICVRADFDISAEVLCRDSPDPRPERLRDRDGEFHGVMYDLPVKTAGNSSDCLFYKKERSDVYTLSLEIAYGEKTEGKKIQKQYLKYLITCTYDNKGINIGDNTSRLITNSYVKPREIQENMGAQVNGTFLLQMVDIRGNPIIGNVPLGRIIRLRGTLQGSVSGVGIRAVSCTASGGGESFALLRGGCGAGIIFKETEGFETNGLIVYSPYFKMFRLIRSNSVLFACNYTECMTNCNGDSCTNSRRRRSLDTIVTGLEDSEAGTEKSGLELISTQLEVATTDCDASNEFVDHETGLVLCTEPQPHSISNDIDTYQYEILYVVLTVTGGHIFIAILATAYVYARKRKRNAPSTVAYIHLDS